MKINKEKFLKTELGSGLTECVLSWDKALDKCREYQYSGYEYQRERKVADWCQAQWQVYQTVLRQFYGTEYCFTRTDDYVGIVSKDGSDWLLKVEKGDDY